MPKHRSRRRSKCIGLVRRTCKSKKKCRMTRHRRRKKHCRRTVNRRRTRPRSASRWGRLRSLRGGGRRNKKRRQQKKGGGLIETALGAVNDLIIPFTFFKLSQVVRSKKKKSTRRRRRRIF